MLLLTQDNPGVGGILNAAASDNDLRFTSGRLDKFDRFQVETANPADVEASIDGGATYLTTVLSLEDVHVAAAVGTRVLVTAANKMYRVAPGVKVTNLRIRQAGATAVGNFKLLCIEPGE